MINGEIDVIQAPTHDLVPLLAKDPNITTGVIAPLGRQFAFRFNVLHKPFDNPKMRQALYYALSQKFLADIYIENSVLTGIRF